MRPVLHMIWLGGSPPMWNVANLHRVARMFATHPADAAAGDADAPYVPVLWMDSPALRATLAESVTPVELAAPGTVPDALQRAARAALGPHHHSCRWLRIAVRGDAQLMPVLLYEDLRPFLAEPWHDLSGVQARLVDLASSGSGRAFLRDEARLADGPVDVAQAVQATDGPDVAACLDLLTDHARTRWGPYGLLCLASDLLRLQAMALFPGAYIDVGDVAGKIARLPTQRLAHAEVSAFCGHQTIAIENDMFLCLDATLMQAIAFGTWLWGMNTLRDMAPRLGVAANDLTPSALLRQVLPHIDARMPQAPDVAVLFEPPHATLANYVCRAYGGEPLLGDACAIDGFFRGYVPKEKLIDHVGGFTGYQKFAHHLAPRSAEAWALCAAGFGLQDYAPQLGWKVHGFGLFDRLIGNARSLSDAQGLAPYAEAELVRLAGRLGMAGPRLRRVALFCAAVFDLASRAHLNPSQRDASRARIAELALALEEGATAPG